MMNDNSVACKYHPNEPLIEDHQAGDLICPRCGLVVARAFGVESDRDRSRVGYEEDNLLSSSSNLSTLNASNSSRKKSYIWKANDKTLIYYKREIRNMACNLRADSIASRAIWLFKMVYEGPKLGRIRNKDAIAASCLYIACRQDDAPRSFKEVVAVANVNVNLKTIRRCFKSIVETHRITLKEVTAKMYLHRFCSKLSLSKVVEKYTNYILKKKEKSVSFEDRSPDSIAAAAIYMACQVYREKKTQKEISDVSGVCISTIAANYHRMYPPPPPVDWHF